MWMLITCRIERLWELHADCMVLRRILEKCIARHEEEIAQINEKIQKISKEDAALLEQFKAKLTEKRSSDLSTIQAYLSKQDSFLKQMFPDIYT